MPDHRIVTKSLRSDGLHKNNLAGKQRDSIEKILLNDYAGKDLPGRSLKRNPRIHSSRYAEDSMEEDCFLTDAEQEYGRSRRRRSHPESRGVRLRYKYIRVPVYPKGPRSRRSRSLVYENFPRSGRQRTELRQTIRRSNSFKQSSRPNFAPDRSSRNVGYRNGGNGFVGNTGRSVKGGGPGNGRWRHDRFKKETQKRRMTPEELDKELEAYMKTSKHPRVEEL